MIADYFLTGVWKKDGDITDVLLHLNNDNVLGEGKKTSLPQTVNLLMGGLTIFALKWDYAAGRWMYLSPVEVAARQERKSIYCKYPEAGVTLCNLINMENFQPARSFYSVPLIKKRSK